MELVKSFGIGGLCRAGDAVVYSNGRGDIPAHVVAVPKWQAFPARVPVVFDSDPEHKVQLVSMDDVY